MIKPYTYVEINLRNLVYNLEKVREKVYPAEIMAIVKADAYGHGLIEVSRALTENGVKFLAVARITEVEELVKAGIKANIILFGALQYDEMEYAINKGIRISIVDHSDVDKVAKAVEREKTKCVAHVKVDTGMNRVGIKPECIDEVVEKLKRIDNLILEGIYSHFSTSDEKDKTFANLQLKRFKEVLSRLIAKGYNFKYIHMANSGAILDLPSSYFNMVRPGITLYGNYPSLETTESIKLKPVMKFITHVSIVRFVSKGSYISYGRKYKVNKDTNIAVLPVGYADGYSRAFTNKGRVLIKGKLYPVVGAVTMDQLMVDIGNDNIQPGDKAVLWGNDSFREINVTNLAELIGMVPYELTCSVSKRVARIYKY